jgi:Zn-dependent alcohol dehydrogenase
VTSFRGIVDQGKVSAGQWVAIHGCGGVGLSAIMIAVAAGARVVAIDIDDAKLEFARSLGALATVNSRKVDDVVATSRKSRRRRAPLHGRAGQPDHLLQLDRLPAQTRQTRSGGVMLAEQHNRPSQWTR